MDFVCLLGGLVGFVFFFVLFVFLFATDTSLQFLHWILQFPFLILGYSKVYLLFSDKAIIMKLKNVPLSLGGSILWHFANESVPVVDT